MKLLKSILKYDGFLKIFTKTFEVNGEIITRDILERGDAAAAIVYNVDEQKYYFVRQPRPATFNKTINNPDKILELIAGVIDRKNDELETPETCIRREIEEEAGFKDIREVLGINSFFLSPGGSTEEIYLFYVEVGNEGRVETSGVEGEQERIEQVSYTFEEITQRLEMGLFEDAKTIIALQWLVIYKSLRKF